MAQERDENEISLNESSSDSEQFGSAVFESRETAVPDNLPSLQEQRDEFLAAGDGDSGNDNDVVYLLPREWLTRFLRDEKLLQITASEVRTVLGPLDTESILLDPKCPYVLKHNFDLDMERQCYLPVSPKQWELLVSWYGMSPESVEVTRNVLRDKTSGQSIIEFHVPVFYLRKLAHGQMTKINAGSEYQELLQQNQKLYFSGTKTVKELHDTIYKFIVENLKKEAANETDGDSDVSGIKMRIWYLDDPILSNNSQLFMNLTYFRKLKFQKLFTPDTFQKRLCELNIVGGYLLLELNDYKHGQFPTEFLRGKLKNLEGSDPEYSDESNLTQISVPTDGLKGFVNLGNTCYMNSALQCLVHVPELVYYFFYNIYEQELNTQNPLGKDGKFATSFGALIRQLYDSKNTRNSSIGSRGHAITPRDFKSVVGHYNSMFYGYQQHDSQEFLAYLLDGLHEDLNRILQKPYTEKPEISPDKINDEKAVYELAQNCWNNHKMRNDSVILDLFTGVYKSTLKCPECKNVSLTFDPFSDLTLPIPTDSKWEHKVYILRDEEFAKPQILEVELCKTGTFVDLKAYVSRFSGIKVTDLYACEIFQSQVYRNFESSELLHEIRFNPISELIASDDVIVFYELKDFDASNDTIIPVISTVKEDTIHTPFSIPFFIKLSKSEARSFGTIRERIEQKYSCLSSYNYFSEIRKNSRKRKFQMEDFPHIDKVFQKHGIKRERRHDFRSRESSFEQIKIEEANSDYEPSPEYDSDISLANPEICSSYAFEMKLYSESVSTDDKLYIPTIRGHFSSLAKLSDKLPLVKKIFYSYSADDYMFKESGTETPEEVVVNLPGGMPITNDVSEVEAQDPEVKDAEVLSDEKVQDVVENSVQDISEGLEQVLQSDSVSSNQFTEIAPSEFDSDYVKLALSDAENHESLDSDSDSFSTPSSDIDSGKSIEKHGALVQKGDIVVCEWESHLHQVFFCNRDEDEDEGGTSTIENAEVLPNEELESKRQKAKTEVEKKLTLQDCLRKFSEPEILGQNDLWYCPTCKDHRQAEKQIEIWSVPEILTIHLKRFATQRRFSDKIDDVVEFPIENLDLKEFIAKNEVLQKELNGTVYDLFAVDNHFGGTGGGHYTAYVKNFVDEKWYYYDDSSVRPANPESAISGSAYLLFYRRRGEKLGGEKFWNMLENAKQEEERQIAQQRNEQLNKMKSIVVQIEQMEQLTQSQGQEQAQEQKDSFVENEKSIDGATQGSGYAAESDSSGGES